MKPLNVVIEKISDFNRKYNEKNYGIDKYRKLQERLIKKLNRNPIFSLFNKNNYPSIEVWKFSNRCIHFGFKKELKLKKSNLEEVAKNYNNTKLSYNSKIPLKDGKVSINFSYKFLSFSLNPPPEIELLEKLINICNS